MCVAVGGGEGVGCVLGEWVGVGGWGGGCENALAVLM